MIDTYYNLIGGSARHCGEVADGGHHLMLEPSVSEPWAAREMAGALLPNERCRPNLVQIAENIASNGGASFSSACGHAGRQAARRLFRNERTNPEGLMNGHVQQTAARCSELDLVLCIQDTTILDYTTHRGKKG